MTVKELKDRLVDCPDDMLVAVEKEAWNYDCHDYYHVVAEDVVDGCVSVKSWGLRGGIRNTITECVVIK